MGGGSERPRSKTHCAIARVCLDSNSGDTLWRDPVEENASPIAPAVSSAPSAPINQGGAAMKDTEKRKRTPKRERRGSVSLLERLQSDAASIDCGRRATLLPSRPAPIPSQCVSSAPSPRPSSFCRLAFAMWGQERGDGIHRGILDSTLRDSRGARVSSGSRQTLPTYTTYADARAMCQAVSGSRSFTA